MRFLDKKRMKTLSKLTTSDDFTVFTKDVLKNADLIAFGRFGSVYCANTSKFGKVSVKLLCTTTGDLQLLINMMKHTHHVNIVRFFGIVLSDIDEKTPVGFVMEHMENGSVYNVLHKNKILISDDMKFSWIYQAGRALDFLHGKGLIHRDVTPVKMLLSNSHKTLRMGGMGFCCRTEDQHLELDGSVGTEIYVAPEIRAPKTKYTNKVDVFSLGISIFEIITRKRPFGSWSKRIAYYGHNNILGVPRFPDGSIIEDSSVRSLVERTWHKNPEKRPTMAEIVTFFEEKEQAFIKLTAKKTVFYSTTADANIFTMDMFKDAERVGSGTYGNVFKTKTENFGDFAAKIFKNCVTEQEQREIINMVKHSNHSNIVRFLGIVTSDVSSAETTVGYVMEYMSDKTVYDALHNDDAKIPSELRYSWICQAGRALTYLHGRGILHRDVKPLNMLLCDSRQLLKVCDMGMSKNFLNEESLSIGIIGTMEYVAPEVLNASRGKDAYSCRADVYSMAISIWEIISRGKPYEDVLKEVSICIFGSGIINGTVRPGLDQINDLETKTFLTRAWNSIPHMRPEMKEIVEFFENKRKDLSDITE